MEVGAAAQFVEIIFEVLQFVGIVHHQQAGFFKARHFVQQLGETLLGGHLFVERQTQRMGKAQHRIHNALLAGKPSQMGIVVFEGEVVGSGKAGFTHAADAVHQQNKMGAAEQRLVQLFNFLISPNKKRARNGVFGQFAR